MHGISYDSQVSSKEGRRLWEGKENMKCSYFKSTEVAVKVCCICCKLSTVETRGLCNCTRFIHGISYPIHTRRLTVKLRSLCNQCTADNKSNLSVIIKIINQCTTDSKSIYLL